MCDGYPELVELVDDDFIDILADVVPEVCPARAETSCHMESGGIGDVA